MASRRKSSIPCMIRQSITTEQNGPEEMEVSSQNCVEDGPKRVMLDKDSAPGTDSSSTEATEKKGSETSLPLRKQGGYECKYCPFSTQNLNDFKEHVDSSHPNVILNPLYLCAVCNFNTKKFDTLTEHNERCHPGETNFKFKRIKVNSQTILEQTIEGLTDAVIHDSAAMHGGEDIGAFPQSKSSTMKTVQSKLEKSSLNNLKFKDQITAINVNGTVIIPEATMQEGLSHISPLLQRPPNFNSIPKVAVPLNTTKYNPLLDSNMTLITSFNKFPYPTHAELSWLTAASKHPEEQIKVWFTTQRLKQGITWSPEEVEEARKKMFNGSIPPVHQTFSVLPTPVTEPAKSAQPLVQTIPCHLLAQSTIVLTTGGSGSTVTCSPIAHTVANQTQALKRPIAAPAEATEAKRSMAAPLVSPELKRACAPVMSPDMKLPLAAPAIASEAKRPILAPVVLSEARKPIIAPMVASEARKPIVAPVVASEAKRPIVAPVLGPEAKRPIVAPVPASDAPRPIVAPVPASDAMRPIVAPVPSAKVTRPIIAPLLGCETKRPIIAPVLFSEAKKPIIAPVPGSDVKRPIIAPLFASESKRPIVAPVLASEAKRPIVAPVLACEAKQMVSAPVLAPETKWPVAALTVPVDAVSVVAPPAIATEIRQNVAASTVPPELKRPTIIQSTQSPCKATSPTPRLAMECKKVGDYMTEVRGTHEKSQFPKDEVVNCHEATVLPHGDIKKGFNIQDCPNNMSSEPALKDPAQKSISVPSQFPLLDRVKGKTAEQLKILEESFQRSSLPTHGDVENLVSETRLSKVEIDCWFSERRALRDNLEQAVLNAMSSRREGAAERQPRHSALNGSHEKEACSRRSPMPLTSPSLYPVPIDAKSLALLKDVFAETRWPSPQEYSQLEAQTGLARTQIVRWFKDNRTHLKGGALEWMEVYQQVSGRGAPSGSERAQSAVLQHCHEDRVARAEDSDRLPECARLSSQDVNEWLSSKLAQSTSDTPKNRGHNGLSRKAPGTWVGVTMGVNAGLKEQELLLDTENVKTPLEG